MLSSTYRSAAVSGQWSHLYLRDKKEVQCSPVVLQQGRQDSHHFVDLLQTSLSTDGEKGKKRGKQTVVLHCLLTCGLQDFISKGKIPNAIQNFPEGYIITWQVEAMWFYPGKQVKGYAHEANILSNLAGLSLHILLVNRRNSCLVFRNLHQLNYRSRPHCARHCTCT